MEDAVDASESLISLSNPDPEGGVDEEDEGGTEDGQSEEDAGKAEENGEEEAAEDEGEEEQDSGGGLIDHLISSLPVSIPDVATPDADEASLLISIARD